MGNIQTNSKMVSPGDTFVALHGGTHDGHDFIDEAVRKGAKLVIGEKDIKGLSVPYRKVADARSELGRLADEAFGSPSKKLKVIGVTGTKGKTTTVHMIYHILNSLGAKAGMISSISAKIGEREMDTGFHVTSPDVLSLHRLLKEMADEDCRYAVVEVSSHGIGQKRIAGVNFEIAVLTNISPEHLDYHKTFKEYRRVKMSFLNSAKLKVVSKKHSSLNIFPGEFNNINAETAVEVATVLGFDRNKAVRATKLFKLPEGRMQEIENDRGTKVVVDFAHTPDSLEKALEYLRTKTKGKLISVFGCAGERDVKKRRKMGKISTRIADFSVFTAEDPRSEDIFSIFRAMKKGADGSFIAIPERSEAIAFALSKANPGDTVAFFGKGHEKSMAYKGYEHPYSDSQIVKALLEGRNDVSVLILSAGKGSRMHDARPKVLREICGRPMLAYTLENLRRIGALDITLVVGFRKNLVERRFSGAVKFAHQKNPKGGTADAASAGIPLASKKSKIIAVINGDDSAFYTPKTLKDVIDSHIKESSVITFVSLVKKDPFGLGRVVRDSKNKITGIIEEKDADEKIKKINEVNDGFYVFDKRWLTENIKRVKKGPQGEFYLVDLIKMAIDQGEKVSTYKLPNDDEWHGINTPEQLEDANRKMEERLK